MLGDPVGASAEEGAALLAALTKRLLAAVSAWQVADDGRLLGDLRPDAPGSVGTAR